MTQTLSVYQYISALPASLGAQTVKRLLAIWESLGSIPGSGRSPGEENDNPLQYSCLENSIDGMEESGGLQSMG